MDRVEAYVRRATRGVWGAKRREIREELSAHIADGLRRYRLMGHSEDEAVTRVLADLGHPREVSGGMARLYALPQLAAPTALLAALAVFAVLLVSESAAQNLEVTYRHPSAGCLEGTAPDEGCDTGIPWTSLEALKAALEPQGAHLSLREHNYLATLELPGGRTVYLPTQTRTFSLREDGAHVSTQVERGYFTLWELIQELGRASGLLVRFGVWGVPEIHVGDLTLRWNPDEDSSRTWNPYDMYMSAVTFSILNGARLVQPTRRESLTHGWRAVVSPFTGEPLAIRVGEPGVYGLIAVQDPASAPHVHISGRGAPPDTYALSAVAPADPRGVVRLGDREPPMTFVANTNELFAGGEGAVGRALLIRLTGEAWGDAFGYEVVPPDAFSVLTPASE